MWRPVIAAALLMAVVACSSGDSGSERVLHLNDGDFTEEAYRVELRAVLVTAGDMFCPALQGLSPREALAVLLELDEGQTTPTVQAGDSADLERAAAIFIEECDRIAE